MKVARMGLVCAVPVLAACLTVCQAEPRMPGITGYNYTDRYIDAFSVDGQGGGNVLLSEDDAGGGKTSCCILPREPTIFVVHFYPDDTVQVEVAENYPKPRLKRSSRSHKRHAERSFGLFSDSPAVNLQEHEQ